MATRCGEKQSSVDVEWIAALRIDAQPVEEARVMAMGDVSLPASWVARSVCDTLFVDVLSHNTGYAEFSETASLGMTPGRSQSRVRCMVRCKKVKSTKPIVVHTLSEKPRLRKILSRKISERRAKCMVRRKAEKSRLTKADWSDDRGGQCGRLTVRCSGCGKSETQQRADNAEMRRICAQLGIVDGVHTELKLHGYESHVSVYREVKRWVELEEDAADGEIETLTCWYLRDVKSKIKSEGKIGRKWELIPGIKKRIRQMRQKAMDAQ
jgi:hypothetical protein